MPKKRTLPPPSPRYLKFRFQVPFIVPVSTGSQTLPMAREKVEGMVKHGDYLLNLDLANAKPHSGRSDSWPAEIAWMCPQCIAERWFPLNHERSCKDSCPGCGKQYIVIEGFIHRNKRGCDSCDQRIECLLIPRAEVITVTEEETL